MRLTSWLEDYPNYYVQLFRNPVGIGFPDNNFPSTKTHFTQETIRIGDIDLVLKEYIQWNLWRSWEIFSDKDCSKSMGNVPLLIDIDNEEYNLAGAYDLTRDCLDWFESTNQFSVSNYLRLVFSGLKGFHIEARPSKPVDNRNVRKELLLGLQKMGHSYLVSHNCFKEGTIDLGHDFIRLTGSYNSWKEGNSLRRRKVIQLSLEDFKRTHINHIVEMSEAT